MITSLVFKGNFHISQNLTRELYIDEYSCDVMVVAVVCYHFISAAGGCGYAEIFPGLHFI